jgi:hypothetical protein
MKNLLLLLSIWSLCIITSCKTNRTCDAYSQNLNIQIDSLNLQIKNKKDSINMLNDIAQLLNDYIIFLENDNQFLGSVLAEKELEDGIE